MLPVIQEQLLLIKVLQGVCQTLLGLSLGYLVGGILLTLPGKALLATALPSSSSPRTPVGPKIFTGRRTGLLIALIMACNLLLMKIAYRPVLFSGPFWGGLTILFVIGVALILVARQYLQGSGKASRLAFLAAAIGDLLLLAICFFLLNAESLLLTPQWWPFLPSRPPLLLTWHGTTRFVQFILLALMLAGLDRQHRRQWLILAAALLWPLCQILELLLTPELARSSGLYLAAALALLTTLVLAQMIAGALRHKRILPLAPPLAAVIALTLFWVLGAQTARENTLTGVALAGLQLPPVAERSTELPAAPTSPQPKVKTQSPAAIDGSQLFQQKCTICHRFDQRLVGPPLNTVLGKYRLDKENLRGFLGNPQKVNPDYPSMPNLNLTEEETAALADFLLNHEAAQPAP